MIDLTREMTDLMSALGRAQGKTGRVIMFVSAYSGEGVSTVAREYARCEAAFATRPVWLVDADLRHQTQMAIVKQDQERFGPPGPLSHASPNGKVFFEITPQARDRDGRVIPDDKYLISRSFLDRNLWVTRFRSRQLAPGQRVRLREDDSYWKALRVHAQTIVVDVPAAEQDSTALQLAPFVDAIVMIVSEDDHDVGARLALREEIERAGGRLMGMVYNRARTVKGAVRPATSRIASAF